MLRRCTLLVAGAALLAVPAARAQNLIEVTPAAETQLVRRAAFTLWWPEYDRLMREFLRNTPSDTGRIALPDPSPDRFFREIEILGRIPAPLGSVALYSVTTEGDLFQGLFVISRTDRAWPLINRVDPATFRQEMSNDYVDAFNALLTREGVRPTNKHF